jgi:DNA-entry nuclease
MKKHNGLGCIGYIWGLIIVLGMGGALFYGVVHLSNQRHFDILGEMSKWASTIWKNTDKTGLDSFHFGESDEKINQLKEEGNKSFEQAKEGASSILDKGKATLNKAGEAASSHPNNEVKASINYGKTTDLEPTESLAHSVLSEDVLKQLGKMLTYNGHGSYIVNNNQATLTPLKGSPWLQSGVLNGKGQLSESSALLSHAMYGKRVTTETKWQPAGYHQLKIDAPEYGNYLWNKGHSIGAAMTSAWSGDDVSFTLPIKAVKKGQWNASEYYAENITTQTSWANQAIDGSYGTKGYGQNYYEDEVRKEQITHKKSKIAYCVKPIYSGDNKVPSGTQIQALSSDGDLNFNVFVPNVQMGVQINYQTGQGKIVG